VSRAQLHEGTQIRTTYDEKQGKWIAEQVEIYAGTPSQDRPSAPMK
jgi:hypothetical protein